MKKMRYLYEEQWLPANYMCGLNRCCCQHNLEDKDFENAKSLHTFYLNSKILNLHCQKIFFDQNSDKYFNDLLLIVIRILLRRTRTKKITRLVFFGCFVCWFVFCWGRVSATEEPSSALLQNHNFTAQKCESLCLIWRIIIYKLIILFLKKSLNFGKRIFPKIIIFSWKNCKLWN